MIQMDEFNHDEGLTWLLSGMQQHLMMATEGEGQSQWVWPFFHWVGPVSKPCQKRNVCLTSCADWRIDWLAADDNDQEGLIDPTKMLLEGKQHLMMASKDERVNNSGSCPPLGLI